MSTARIEEGSAARAQPRRWILAALMCTMMLAAMDTTIVATAIPQIVGDLGGFAHFSWVFSIYLLAQTVTIPIYGKLADLVGRKPVLMVGTLLFLAGSAACAASWSMPSLIAFRGLQGVGAGSIMASVTTLAGDLYPVRQRGAIQGWLSSVWGVAAIAGPVIGGALADYASWHWIFLINLPIGLAALSLIGAFLHERFEPRQPRIDYAGAGLVLVAVGALIVGLLQGGQSWPWLSPTSAAVFSVAAIAAGLAVRVEGRAAEPVMPGWLWRDRLLGGCNLSMIGMGLVMMAPSTFLPTFSQSVQGLGAIGAGLVLACMSIGWPVASALSARAYMRIGFRDAALGGALLIVVALLAFYALPEPAPIWGTVITQVLLGAGFGLLSTPLLIGAQSVVGWERRGVVTGANMFSRYLGQSLGAAIVGAIFNATLSARLAAAPASYGAGLPRRIDAVIDALHAPGTDPAAQAWLRDAIDVATRHVFAAMALPALGILLALLFVPRHFPTLPDRRDEAAPARAGRRGAESARSAPVAREER
ncbi:MAG: Multidrug resistance protein 3 [Gammaproteobacteria bacterium]|nr:Multidrug resistance protein 3 [Gammaproteobacteria bacterium]